jgi:regulator of replication initiation timing
MEKDYDIHKKMEGKLIDSCARYNMVYSDNFIVCKLFYAEKRETKAS